MAEVYDPHEHVFVLVKLPKNAVLIDEEAPVGMWRDLFEIVLHTGNRVWVRGTYMHVDSIYDAVQVGDCKSKGYDDEGNCILSVPAEWCSYYSEAEAENIARLMAADLELLSYAR